MATTTQFVSSNEYKFKNWKTILHILVNNTPLVDQRPSRIYIFAEYLHPVVAICLDEHTEWLSCTLSLQQRRL